MIFTNPFTQKSSPGNPGGPGSQPQGQQQGNTNQGNIQPQNNNNTSLESGNGTGQGNQNPGSGTVPGNNGQQQQGQQSNNPAGGDDPMLKFDSLWDNPTVDPNDPTKNQQPQEQSYLPKLDPAKLQEYVNGMDFTKSVVTPELMAAITAGGEGASQAMFSIINGATKQAMMTAFQASTRMMETGLKNAEGGFLGKVPEHVKDMMSKNSLESSNPLMKDPAYSELIDMTRQRFQTKYPKASPSQVETATNKYFDDMYTKMTGAKTKAGEQTQDNTQKLKTGAPDGDWEQWAGSEVAGIFGPV